MRFESVVFSDTASLAALSCFTRLGTERDAGRTSLIVPLVDGAGAGTIEGHGLATVRPLEDLEAENHASSPGRPIRERIAVLLRAIGPRHVLAPLGLLGAPQSIDYFNTLRAAMSVDKGRDLLFFEERPHCQVPEAVPLRLAAMGVRLPPAIHLRSPRGYLAFATRVIAGVGVPPIFGGFRERTRLCRSLKTAFRETADWAPHRALGPKLQPVIESSRPEDADGLLSLARELGREEEFGTAKAFRRRVARHARSAGRRTPIERYWLSLSNADESDSGR